MAVRRFHMWAYVDRCYYHCYRYYHLIELRDRCIVIRSACAEQETLYDGADKMNCGSTYGWHMKTTKSWHCFKTMGWPQIHYRIGLTENAGYKKRWKTELSSLESNQAMGWNGKSAQSILPHHTYDDSAVWNLLTHMVRVRRSSDLTNSHRGYKVESLP